MAVGEEQEAEAEVGAVAEEEDGADRAARREEEDAAGAGVDDS